MALDKHNNNQNRSDSNEANCLLTAHKLLKWNARVVGVVSFDDPKFTASYCFDLANAIHQISSNLISTLVSEDTPNRASQQTNSFFIHKHVDFKKIETLDVISNLAHKTQKANHLLFIDLLQLVDRGNHLETSQRCDKIILMVPQRKSNEFSLKKKIKVFEQKEKIELVLVSR